MKQITARQVQIRRGTATENDAFIGAVGEITMDTTNKTIRVHDGETPGGTKLAKADDNVIGDYVIETQLPTAENNYTWYRKYKSGWVEQGGQTYDMTIAFMVKMANTQYAVSITGESSNTNNNVNVYGCQDLTVNGFTSRGNVLNSSGGSAASNGGKKHWRVYGIYAQ